MAMTFYSAIWSRPESRIVAVCEGAPMRIWYERDPMALPMRANVTISVCLVCDSRMVHAWFCDLGQVTQLNLVIVSGQHIC